MQTAGADGVTSAGDQLVGPRFRIIVNGREKIVDHMVLTFDEVVRLAFDPVPTGPNIMFTITYSRAVKPQHEGILSEGGEVTIRPGTIFDVTRTNKS